MILNDLRFRKGMPIRIITDAHRSSTNQAVINLLKERGARMQFVLSGATEFTQFMDIRGGAAQVLKNGGVKSTDTVIKRFYDKNQTTKYKRIYSHNGQILPMRINDAISIVEEALKTRVTNNVVKKAWDAVAIDLLPDLHTLMSLTTELKRAFLHTPSIKESPEDVADA